MFRKKQSIIFAVFTVMLLLLLLILLFVFKKNDEPSWFGRVPNSSDSETSELASSDNIPESLPPSVSGEEPENFIYPENVDFWEESLTGGGIPQKYTDSDGNEYTKKYFPSFGYAMYIPDNWTRIEHSNSYLQNIYYLVTDKEDYEDIQISIATKTATSGLSSSQVRNLFRTTRNNIEYYYRHGTHKFITTMYEAGDIHQITTSDIPGFENIDENKILVYYDEPEVTFIMEKEPTYYVEPYVIDYYIIKDNVAVMLTVIGPRSKAANMNYLLTAMGLNCKELYNANANRVHYSADTVYGAKAAVSVKGSSEWKTFNGGAVNKIQCALDETDALYGTEILYANKVVPKEDKKPQDLLADSDITSAIAYSALDFNETIPNAVLMNLDYSVKYSPSDITHIPYGKTGLTKINFTCTIDETSLFRQLAIIENPFKAVMYIKETSKGYAFIIIKYNSVNSTYIESFAADVLSNTTWPA